MPVSGLLAGTYTLYFGVDTVMDGNVTWDSVYYNTVVVNITEYRTFPKIFRSFPKRKIK